MARQLTCVGCSGRSILGVVMKNHVLSALLERKDFRHTSEVVNAESPQCVKNGKCVKNGISVLS